jgi:hypothetical protein
LPTGLYEVDVGLKTDDGDQGSHIMVFADINNDKYTDIITVNSAKSAFTVHIFDVTKNMFNFQKTFKAGDCVKITNIAAGRSVDKLRLFITCQDVKGGTQMKFLDKGKYMDFVE